MSSSDYTWLAPSVAFLVAAIGWLLRELYFRREWRSKATLDAGQILKEQKAHIEEMISKTDDKSQKEKLCSQLDEINGKLRGLLSVSLRRTLKIAGLPTEEMLIAEGRSQLKPQQVAQLNREIAEVKSLPPSDSIQELFTLANAYYYAGKYDDAKETYDKILNLNPNNPTILHSRGVTYGQLGKYDEALADFNRSLELRPDAPGTLINRGNAYTELARYDEAFADLNRSLELNPNDPAAFNNRGNAYFRLERYDEALADFNRSLELRPDHPDTLCNRGNTYHKLGRFDEALADYNRSLELRPDHPSTLYNIACLFSLWGKTDNALVYLEKAIALDKKYREMAKTDKDLDNIRDDPRFKELTE